MCQPEYKVIVSEAANLMLVEHARFLSRVSINAANRLIDAFEKAAKSLETMPLRCPVDSTIEPLVPYRKMIIEKRYLILFEVVNTTVYIDYILDCRQDYAWLLR